MNGKDCKSGDQDKPERKPPGSTPTFDCDAQPPPSDPAIRQRAQRWQLRWTTLTFDQRPAIMGIVNVTPDSFSDGGQFLSVDQAVAHGLRLVEHGAAILDIGGESTRPYAEPVSPEEETRRVMPVIKRLRQLTNVPLSVDTSKAQVAQAAIDAGAEIVNDVTGLTGDPQMLDTVARSGVGVCAMHARGTPQTMQDNPVYEDVVAEIMEYLSHRRDALLQSGIEAPRICLDPGIGFGKTHQHNITLLANCHIFHRLGCPVLIGHSRKGFLGKLLGDPAADRTHVTVGSALAMAARGIQILRVHDVLALHQALTGFSATGGLCQPEI